jgi:hypothetical protein
VETKRSFVGPSPKKGCLMLSFYNVFVPHDGTPFLWKSVWRIKVSLRAAIFVWLVSLGKILTMDNLKKRHVIVVNLCCICKRSIEFVYYFLLNCEVASAV